MKWSFQFKTRIMQIPIYLVFSQLKSQNLEKTVTLCKVEYIDVSIIQKIELLIDQK